jgi:hypothetical protein
MRRACFQVETALAHCRRDKPSPAAKLCDKSGHERMARIRGRHRKRRRPSRCGQYGFQTKPLLPTRLLKRLALVTFPALSFVRFRTTI